MQKKTIHRILGILVIAGLVVILLPLFQNGKEDVPTEITVVKAPPFPDQPVQLTSETTTTEAGTQPQAPSPVEQPSASASKISPVVSQPVEEPKAVTQASTTSVTSLAKPDRLLIEAKSIKKNKKLNRIVRRHTTKKIFAQVNNQKIDKNGLIQLKNAAWVVQIGSFKNKANAFRLVNRLRANGYKAFIQQISLTFGENIRVYVGPEFKQASARTLADQLEQDLHIRGIVISYKPLTL